jgi:uncharacterized protein with HEPN domain
MEVDLDIVWAAAKLDLPELRRGVETILAEENGD